MKKNNLNFIIDAVMFILMMAIIGIGFLMKYILINGEQRWDRFGQNPDMFVLGLERHEWGTVHLVLGIILSALLILHIVLHWRQITCIFSHLILKSGLRFGLVIFFTLASIFLLVFPWIIPVQMQSVSHARGQGRFSVETKAASPVHEDKDVQPETESAVLTLQDVHDHDHESLKNSDIAITGQMTLQNVSENFNVPVNVILSKLDLPTETSPNERLGRLRRQYNFRMSDIAEIISEYQTKHP